MEGFLPIPQTDTTTGDIRIPDGMQIESRDKRGNYRRMEQILRPEFEDHVLERTLYGLNCPVFVISRGVEIGSDGHVRPATFGRLPTAPNNGSRASGESRIMTLGATLRAGLLNTDQLIATSGDATITDPVTKEKTTINYGQAHIDRLEREGITELPDGRPIHMDIQGASNDTFGEVLATGAYLRERVASDPTFAEALSRSGGEITFFSSDDQLPRLAALQVLTEFQGKTPEEASEGVDFLREQLQNGPIVRYINAYREQIVELAKNDPSIAENTLKTLFLLDNVDLLTDPKVLQWASRGHFRNPRFADTIQKCAPHLREDIEWMKENGIKINHLTTEEVIIALEKRIDAAKASYNPDDQTQFESDRREAEKLMRWLSNIYGIQPENNELLSTFLMEMAGTTDLLTNYYYAQGSLKDEKARFVQALSQEYDISLPVSQ